MSRAPLRTVCRIDEPEDPRVARSRAKVLAAATELIVESGPRAVTVDSVAERSGVAKSTMYRHWSSRAELLVDVVRSSVPEMVDPPLDQGFEVALRHLVRALAGSLGGREWAHILPACFALRQQIPEVAQITDEDRDEKMDVIRRILDLGVAEGRLPEGLAPEMVGHVLLGPLIFAAITGEAGDLTRLADYTIDRFLASYPA